ncbi:Hypothetical protein PHPALM_6322 [Phytophthora palmivora]|uniref:Uncharacterized protein n=1 Tax=Phytophthora palmivora TaxID=4796 RepID=A0A2P4YF52_9STRA|nr:Hypothetical protein PHPALM_6322 [Phytophthora palmivora]
MEPLHILGRFSLSLSFRLKFMDLLLHSRLLLFLTRVDFRSLARTFHIRFGFALLPALSVCGIQALALETHSFHDILSCTLSFGGTLGLVRHYILRSSFRFSPGDFCMNQAIREFLDLATHVQVTLFPESLTLQGIHVFSSEELALLMLHTGLPLLLLSQDIQLDLGGPRLRRHRRSRSELPRCTRAARSS